MLPEWVQSKFLKKKGLEGLKRDFYCQNFIFMKPYFESGGGGQMVHRWDWTAGYLFFVGHPGICMVIYIY